MRLLFLNGQSVFVEVFLFWCKKNSVPPPACLMDDGPAFEVKTSSAPEMKAISLRETFPPALRNADGVFPEVLTSENGECQLWHFNAAAERILGRTTADLVSICLQNPLLGLATYYPLPPPAHVLPCCVYVAMCIIFDL